MRNIPIKKVSFHQVFKAKFNGELYIRLGYDYKLKLYNCIHYKKPSHIIKFRGDTIVEVDSHFDDDLPF